MEIIEIQCGSCNEMMAISVDHLGTQVHCPHCQAIVQAPPREALAPAAAQADEQESIFAEPEQDDLFGSEPTVPKVELPEAAKEAPVAPAHGPRLEQVPDLTLDMASAPAPAAVAPSSVAPSSVAPSSAAPSSAAPSSATALLEKPAPVSHLDLGGDEAAPPSLARVSRKRSLLLPTLLIFLVPYSIVATVFVVLLMMNRPNPAESFERLPDPEPAPGKDKKGPPRKVTRLDHREPLPVSLITGLNKPLIVGDIEFTALEVHKTLAGSLALRFRVKNLSKDYAFVPISKAFLDMSTPYTFLHTRDIKSGPRLYGGFLEYQTRKGEPNLKSSGEILPGAEEMVQITTMKKMPDTAVKDILGAREKLIWRVQLRRGLIEFGDKAYSATAVVGVEFNKSDIRMEKPPPDEFGDA